MDRTDVVDAVALALSVLAVVAQATVVVVAATALLGLVWAPARGLLREVAEGLRPGLLWGAWGVAALATAGSLFFSEYAKFVPCGLCWYQRIAMYPLSVILLIAAVRRDYAAAARFGLPLVAFGAAVSVWHNYVERHPEARDRLLLDRRDDVVRGQVDRGARLRDDPGPVAERVRPDRHAPARRASRGAGARGGVTAPWARS